MLHFYDSSPWSLDIQETRLKSALVMSNAGIKCLVWGEDALAYIHFVPSCLFDLQLIVADEDLQAASTAITRFLPYKPITCFKKRHVESILFYPSQPKTFLYSVSLELTTSSSERSIDDPEIIFIHPQSQFYCDVQDDSLSLPLAPFPDNIRFPTLSAFFDSMISTYLDPPSGRLHRKLQASLVVWMNYLLLYTFRNEPAVLSNGDLEPEHEKLLQNLKPENRPYFDSLLRTDDCHIRIHQMRRKEVLEKLGRYEEARRPLPVGPPGNPALQAQRLAARASSRRLEATACVANSLVVPIES